jgi:hypothetical protein
MRYVPDRTRDALGSPGSNIEAAFEGTTQGREGGLRNMGAGRCDLKIVTPYSSSPKREDRGRRKDRREQAEESIHHNWIGWRL